MISMQPIKQRKGQAILESSFEKLEPNLSNTNTLIKTRNYQNAQNHHKERIIPDKNRPFFSVVIPCYNSGNDLRLLLQSLVDQKMSKKELEIIIADDCSTKSYQNILDEFKDTLNIKQTKTDYNYCPGNTRQRGSETATGKWMIFSDHDDLFEKDVFSKVKQLLVQNPNAVLCVTGFRHVDENDTNKTIEQYVPSQGYGWTHGKFFNMDNFWLKYNFHYPKDLESHEDISITSQQICLLEEHPELQVLYTDNFNTYRWIAHSKSTSNTIYRYKDDPTPRPFIDIFFTDYLKSTLEIYLEAFKNKQISYKTAQSLVVSALLFGYFYQEGNIFKNSNYIRENYQALTKYLREIKVHLHMNIIDIYNFFKYDSNNLLGYFSVFEQSINATGPTIYEHSLKEWLEMIDTQCY